MHSETTVTKADIIRERWLRGRLDYKLHSGQKKIRDAFDRSPGQLFVGECARQFGKTIFEVILALSLAFKKPKAKIKIGTAFHTDLLEFIIPAFDVVMHDCPSDLRPTWIAHKSKFILPSNGSEIKLIGLDRKPNGLRGTVIDLIILSEAGFISNLSYLYKSVIIPATTHRPDCRVTMLSTPPHTPAHDFLEFVQKAEMEGAYVKLTIYENPLLDETTINRLMQEAGGAESTTWKREYLCQHVTDAGLVIIDSWKDEYVQDVPRDTFYPYYFKYVSMDLGVRDNTAILFGYYDFRRGQLIIENEFVVNGAQLTTLLLNQEIREIEKTLWGQQQPYKRVSDNNNPLLLQDLSLLHGLHFSATDKGRLEEMVNTVKIMVRQGAILVNPCCKQLIGCLKYGIWDKNRAQFAQSNLFGHFDALAALIYLVRNLNRTTNPIPVDFQVDKDNQMLIQRESQSNNMVSLKKAFQLRRG